jgi:hypothetical protein
MGWTSCHSWGSYKEAFQEEVSDWESTTGSFKVLKWSIQGVEGYALCQNTRTTDEHYRKLPEPVTTRYIMVCIGSKQDGTIAVKVMDETMHPYYFKCPPSYLKKCTEPENENSTKWRATVLLHKEKQRQIRSLVAGDIVETYGGRRYVIREKLKQGWMAYSVVDEDLGIWRVMPGSILKIEKQETKK